MVTNIRLQIVLGLTVILLASLLVVGLARAQHSTTFCNSSGQTTGTATTSGNTTTFRNEKGQTTGTATTNSTGTTTFRNEKGQTTGTATRSR